MARQTRSWEFDLEEGHLDSARLARVVANPTHSLSYKWEKETEFKDTVVSLLIDNSGSMRGRPIIVAATSADILARAASLSELLDRRPEARNEISRITAARDTDIDRLAYLPLIGRDKSYAFIIDAETAEPVDIIDVDPWSDDEG